MRFPFRPITKPQIKRINKIVKDLLIQDRLYHIVLRSFGVSSLQDLNREAASRFEIKLIETRMLKEDIDEFSTQIPTGVSRLSNLVYFSRLGKATNDHICYAVSLWNQLTGSPDYSELMRFTKEVVGEQYIYMESLSVGEINNVIKRLEIINKQKELR